MKRAAHLTLSVILILLFSSCEGYWKEWDLFLFPDKQVFCWSAEYEINGEKKEDEKYAYNDDYWFKMYPERFAVLSFTAPEGQDAVDSGKSLSVKIDTFDLMIEFFRDGESCFKAREEYAMNSECVVSYSPTGWGFPFEMEIANGSYRFDYSSCLFKDEELTVHFEAETVIRQVAEWYQGPLTVGDTIHIAKGIVTQPLSLSSSYSDICHEIIKD